jgi:hypothetical protein
VHWRSSSVDDNQPAFPAEIRYDETDEERPQVYELFDEVAATYGDQLQLIVVDNDLPVEVSDKLASAIMLTLSQSDRLVGLPDPGDWRDTTTSDRPAGTTAEISG